MKNLYTTILLTSLMIILSCDWVEMPTESKYEQKIVINGMLFAHQQLNPSGGDFEDGLSFIKVNKTADITDVYNSDTTACSVDSIWIYDINTEVNYPLVENENYTGIYYNNNLTFEEGHAYQLTVIDLMEDGAIDTVFAETTIPSALIISETIVNDENIGDLNGQTLTYNPAISGQATMFNPIQIKLYVSASNEENSPAMGRIMNYALEPSLDEYLEYHFDEQTPPVSLEEHIRNDIMITEDDTLLAFLWKWHHISKDSLADRIMMRRSSQYSFSQLSEPLMMGWTVFTFYGPQLMTLYALDENYLNYHIGNLEGPPSDPHYLPQSNIVNGYGLLCSGNMGVMSPFGMPENAKIFELIPPE
jgi:hypothetical protein